MEEKKLSYYINYSKIINSKEKKKKIKIAILSSFTINGLEETLRVKCANIDVSADIFVPGYNQISQQILDEKSNLYSFSPDLTFLIIDIRDIFGNLFYNLYDLEISQRKNFLNEKFSEICNLINHFSKNIDKKLIIFNFSIPNYTPYGIYEFKIDFGIKEMISEFNSRLINFVKNNESIMIFDFNGFVNEFGASNVFNFREFFFGDVKISIHYIPYLAHYLMGFVKPYLGLSKKCIVLDLDNTLWGGVVGEDGFEGIKLGEYGVGKAFLEFQKLLLSLHKRGIILAINSKNNFNDAIEIIRNHPFMILREENFANIQINWKDKVSNLKQIANELNIGIDSMVFFDDDPVNREFVRENLPMVITPKLPLDPTEFSKLLMSMNDFNLLKITNDDKSRGKMYFETAQRKKFENISSNLEEFLEKLQIKIEFLKPNQFTIPRISQLTLKTNQFNLTTKRYHEATIKKLSNDKKYLVGCVGVNDKFGDNGITSVFIILKEDEKTWIIDTFLLSCRIMGRKIEDAILAYVLEKAKESGVVKVIGKFIPTNKNMPSENFLKNNGFIKEKNDWIFYTSNQIKFPSHIEMKYDE